MERYLSIFILMAQIIVIPFFFHIDSVAKPLFISLFLVFTVFKYDKYLSCNSYYSYAVLLVCVLFCSSLSLYGATLLLYLVLLFLYSLVLSGLNRKCQFSDTFFEYYSVFVVFVSSLGLYEYFSFISVGISKSMLIPYILPADKGFRIAGIYGQPNLFALLLVLGVFVFIYHHLHNQVFVKARFSILKFLPLLTVSTTFFLTGSRAGLLALTLTYFLLTWLIVRKRYLFDNTRALREFLALSFVLLLAFCTAFLLNSLFSSESARGISAIGVSADARFIFWTSAFLIFLDHPWFGVGLGNYQYYLPQYVNKAHELLGFVPYEAMGHTKWAHNEIMQLLCEGGIFVFLIIVFLLLIYFYHFYLVLSKGKMYSPLKLYSHLFLLPFILQSLFSWPMRHPSLLLIFFTLLGVLLSQCSQYDFTFHRWIYKSIRILVCSGILFVLFIGYQEFQMGMFARQIDSDNIQTSISDFKQLVKAPYIEFPLLLKITPRYVFSALDGNDVEFAQEILPYVKRLVELQGSYWQWYNLALMYHLVGNEKLASMAIVEAIELRPTKQMYWSFQHYLNMLKASRMTGRPVESFLPIPPGGAREDLEGLFDFDDRFKINM